jgi:hypothetical protein
MFDRAKRQEPLVVLDLCDILVLAKPPGWEVYDCNAERQLAEFLVNLESARGVEHRVNVKGKFHSKKFLKRWSIGFPPFFSTDFHQNNLLMHRRPWI